jgi:hypothetical protein
VFLIAWMLVAYGITILVTGSKLFEPVRRRFEPYPYIHKLISCPMCFGFWVGLGLGLRGIGPGQLLPLSAFEQILSDAFAASAWCWTAHVILAKLGAENL